MTFALVRVPVSDIAVLYAAGAVTKTLARYQHPVMWTQSPWLPLTRVLLSHLQYLRPVQRHRRSF